MTFGIHARFGNMANPVPFVKEQMKPDVGVALSVSPI
jgi:hypothetical protein